MSVLRTASLLAATVTTGLTAGLFTAFSYAVMPGLARTDDRTLVLAMQRINESILNGWFAVCFGGALVFTLLAAALHLDAGHRAVLPWIVAALLLYLVVLGVTAVVNVPLNNVLAQAGDVDRVADLAGLREGFEAAWVRGNVVRAVASTGAFGLLTWALVALGRLPG
ncbi:MULTISPECIES: anthrone oxygenase family protein [unclassified Micromonospora]|uniref:anthrone oxygenase family protein n=1 Tax=unclassified Micromonospora TaxID=2617518 RepID=UPI0033A8F4D4